MTEQDIQDFWQTCEDELKKYTVEFNNKMGIHGFKVEYIVLDKIPVGLIYGLIMNIKIRSCTGLIAFFVQCTSQEKL